MTTLDFKTFQNRVSKIIMYPSVQADAEGNNYAINTKYLANQSLSLNRVDKIRIERADGIYCWYLEKIGTPTDNFVIWQK
jgi:hypothetical protein